MKILIIGEGAREKALAWKIKNSSLAKEVCVAQQGSYFQTEFQKPSLKSPFSWEKLAKISKQKNVDLVVCGPETPLAEGAQAFFKNEGIPFWGPSREAAKLESSKEFAKNIMQAAGIPTAPFELVEDKDSLYEVARKKLKDWGAVALKADGLAAGKGVFLCYHEHDLQKAVKSLEEEKLRSATKKILVEKLLYGRECSHFSLIGKGHSFESLGFAVDFKRRYENDRGPNTGGMGAYAPVPWLPDEAESFVHNDILSPLIKELGLRKIEYNGFLYCGLIWTQDGPFVLEFNVRLGDPEAQVLAVADSRDWLSLIMTSLEKKAFEKEQELKKPLTWNNSLEACVGMVVSSPSYPYKEKEAWQQGNSPLPFHVLKNSSSDHLTQVFSASQELRAEGLLPCSGRALTVVSKAETLKQARNQALEKCQEIVSYWKSCSFRQDIALKVIQGEK